MPRSLRPVARLVAAYALVLAMACGAVRRAVALHPTSQGEIIASVWKGGALVERAFLPEIRAKDPRIDAAVREGGALVFETVVAEGPILPWPRWALGISLVPGKDGLRATLGDTIVYLTPDDLLARQVYGHGGRIDALELTIGLDVARLSALLAERLKIEGEGVDVLSRSSLRRIRVERRVVREVPPITAEGLTRAQVLEGVAAAGRYLGLSVLQDGRFRYAVDAVSNREIAGYEWARHAGATFFLAQAAAIVRNEFLAQKARQAASVLQGAALSSCGGLPCVGDGPVIPLGPTALAVLAFSEIVDKHLDEGYAPLVADLSRFLRAQQRADGEFMHYYDQAAGRPSDQHQVGYYSGEATLALVRAYRITRDPADLEAAVRGLRYLVGPAWSFFGNRYYFAEEHWTCQAMAALWPYAPDAKALDFCMRWHQFGRALQQRAGDSYYDADGAMGVGPLIEPRLTPVASRCEAAVATLAIARRAGTFSPEEIASVDLQVRRALALLLRQQFRPGPQHLFSDPWAVYGAIPGSASDWELRIDYTQHAGSAMVRWLEETEASPTAGSL